MPIDLQIEKILSLRDATRAVPPIDGKRSHASTLWRWARKGIRGVKLEYVRLGHRVCISQEALSRFAQRLADTDQQADGQAISAPNRATPSKRQHQIAAAEAELAKAGI